MSEQSNESQRLDLSTEEWTQKFAEAPIFKKKVLVEAEQVTEPTPLETVLEDGRVETKNVAQPGDYIVTNPGGEKYALKPDVFEGRNEPTEEPGIFRARGMARVIQNSTGQPIVITAPWGEDQFGEPDCMLATVFDPENPDEIGTDRYIIDRKSFLDTYGTPEEVLGQ